MGANSKDRRKKSESDGLFSHRETETDGLTEKETETDRQTDRQTDERDRDRQTDERERQTD